MDISFEGGNNSTYDCLPSIPAKFTSIPHFKYISPSQHLQKSQPLHMRALSKSLISVSSAPISKSRMGACIVPLGVGSSLPPAVKPGNKLAALKIQHWYRHPMTATACSYFKEKIWKLERAQGSRCLLPCEDLGSGTPS